jgi:hypothetical protein
MTRISRFPNFVISCKKIWKLNYVITNIIKSRSWIVFSEICVVQSLVFCVVFLRSLFILLSFFFWSWLSVFDRYTASEYPFDIFKTFWISRFGLCVFKWRYFQQYCRYITVLLVEVTGVNLWLYHKRLQRVYHQMGGYRTHNFSVDWQWLHTYIFKIKLP